MKAVKMGCLFCSWNQHESCYIFLCWCCVRRRTMLVWSLVKVLSSNPGVTTTRPAPLVSIQWSLARCCARTSSLLRTGIRPQPVGSVRWVQVQSKSCQLVTTDEWGWGGEVHSVRLVPTSNECVELKWKYSRGLQPPSWKQQVYSHFKQTTFCKHKTTLTKTVNSLQSPQK